MKHFITNATYADVFTVMALTDREKKAKGGITAFLVEKGTGGLSIGKTQKAMYDGGSKQAEVIFEDCEVDENCIIGGPRNVGMGFATAMKTLDDGRLTISATAIGLARRALLLAAEYAKIRVQFGKAISTNQAIQWMLADSAIEIYGAECMMLDAASRSDAGEKVSAESSMCKVFSTEMAWRVVDRALQIHGGTGYMRESEIERIYRDVRLFRIVEGTSEIQRMIISRNVLK
jgi:acyl-CoA dehydrogenase